MAQSLCAVTAVKVVALLWFAAAVRRRAKPSKMFFIILQCVTVLGQTIASQSRAGVGFHFRLEGQQKSDSAHAT